MVLQILFVLEIIYTFKNHINQTVIACCLVLFIFFSLSVIRDIPIPYEGLPESEFSSEVAFFIGKISYYIGRCIYLIILVIISSIPIFKYKKNNPKDPKDNLKIQCKVCGKTIPYNENETCDECHQKILERLKKKQQITDTSDDVKQNDSIESLEKNFCTNCGKEIESNWKFCKHCGKEI